MYKLRDFSLRRQQRLQPKLSQQVAAKASYMVDLSRLIGECEANFLRLKKLTSSMKTDELRFLVERGETAFEHKLTMLERAKYTTTWLLELVGGAYSPWLTLPKITLRAYHDAQLVEVIAWEGHKRFQPRYEQPNPHSFARDEKYQNNRFLGEWLQDCLNRGLSLPSAVIWSDSTKIRD